MTSAKSLNLILETANTAELETRAEKIENILDVLCDAISPIDAKLLTPEDIRYRQLHTELCDIYQSLFLRYRALAIQE